MTTPSAAVVLVTVPEEVDADAFAHDLVSERVAACVSVFPVMTSVYRWEGAIERGRERQLLIKTQATRLDDLRRRVLERHPYDTPEFLVLSVTGGESRYLEWVASSVEVASTTSGD